MAGHPDSRSDAYTRGVAEDIVAGVSRPDITEVRVSRQYIGAKGIRDVAAAVAASSTLHTLDLDRLLLLRCSLLCVCAHLWPTDVKLSAAMPVLFDAVAQNKSLKKLIIYGLLSPWLCCHTKQLFSHNSLHWIQDDNAYNWGESLSRMLETNTTLTYLSLAGQQSNQRTMVEDKGRKTTMETWTECSFSRSDLDGLFHGAKKSTSLQTFIVAGLLFGLFWLFVDITVFSCSLERPSHSRCLVIC